MHREFHKVRRALRALIMVAGQLLLAQGHAQAADADAAIDATVQHYMQASHIPAAAVAVVQDGRIRVLKAWGTANLEWQAAATVDTAFQTASVSKLVAGVVLMRLVDRGLLGLDDPVSKHLASTPPSWAPITLRHLASHTSGLADGLVLDTDADALTLARAAMQQPLAYAPGTQSRYGITDFVTLAAILEQVSGLDYPALVRREVVEPLRLTHTGFSMLRERDAVRSARLLPQRASTYSYRDGEMREDTFLYPVRAYIAGGLHASVRDLATLLAAIDRGELLTPASRDALITPTRLADGREAGFGVAWTTGRYRGEAATGHSGGPALADVLYLPQRRLGVIVLTNQRRFYPLLAHSIADHYLPAQAPPEPIDDRDPAATQALRALLDEARLRAPARERFDADAGQAAHAYLADFGQAALIALGPIRSIALLSERSLDRGQRERRYRIDFARRSMVWLARTGASQRYLELRPDE